MSTDKEKIRQMMMTHLREKGYPNLTSKQILAELKPMWVKLGEAGLLQKSWKYTDFVGEAEAAEHLINLKAAMQEELMQHFARFRK